MRIEGEMTVYTAAALHTQVSEVLVKRPSINLLDLSEVTEIDTAGLQVLLVARRSAEALGRQLQIVAGSPSVNDVLDLLQLTQWVKPTAAAETKP
jgi:anti-anti-sigma factor